MSQVDIHELTLADDYEVVVFLDELGGRDNSVLGYHYPFYRDMLVAIGVGQPSYLGAWLNGELVGILPAFSRKSTAGTVYNSLPFFGPNAGVICSCRAEQTKALVHTLLLQSLLEIAKQNDALSCSIYTPFLYESFDLYDAELPDAIVVDKFTHYLALGTTPVKWNKKINYDLRKARNHGITIIQDVAPEFIDSFYLLYSQNCRDYDIPVKPKACVDYLVDRRLIGQHSELYLAMYDGAAVAGLLVIWSPGTVSYYMPCTLASARSMQPGSLLIQYAMERAISRGNRIWNWEGSPSRDSSVARFKQKWGSRESTYRIYVKPFRPAGAFRRIGVENLSYLFPYFYVYPYGYLM